MKRMICLLSGLSLVTVATYAEDEKSGGMTDPLEILQKVDAAAKAVKAVEYDVKYEGTGSAERRTPPVTGTYLLSGWKEGVFMPEKFLIDVKVKRRSGTRTLTAGSDGTTFFVIDHDTRKAYTGKELKALGWTRNDWLAAIMREFLHPEPFNDEINAKKRELKGSEKVGKEDCYVIEILYDTPGPQENRAVWCFSKKDFLPRRREQIRMFRKKKSGAEIQTITNLVVDPEFDEEEFKFKLPEGYEMGEGRAP